MSLKRIRRCIRDVRYEFTMHALEELDEDDLSEADAREVLLTGTLAAELTDDPRGVRCVVRGKVNGLLTEVEVVCRLLPSGRVRVITVYSVEE